MRKLSFGLVLLATLSPVAASAQEAQPDQPAAATADAAMESAPAPKKKGPPKPTYRWVELDYGIHYGGDGDERTRSEASYRLSANVLLAKHFYLLAGYGLESFNVSGGPGVTDETDIDRLHAGLGFYYPVTPSTHFILDVTYEQIKFDDTHTDTVTPANNNSDSNDEDGIGYRAGIRTVLPQRSELALTYQRAALEGADGTVTFEDTFDTIALFGATPLTPKLDLTLRAELVSVEEENSTDPDGDQSDDEIYLIGLRFRY